MTDTRQHPAVVEAGNVRFGNHLPLAHHRRALRHGKPRSCAGNGRRPEGDRGHGSASASSTSPPSTRRTAPRPRAPAASALTRRSPIFAEVKETLRPAGLTDVHENDQCAAVGRGRGHPADPGLPVPPDRPPDRRRQDRPGGQREEGPVPRALGHGERRRQGDRRRQPERDAHRARRLLRLQHPGVRHALPADHGRRPARR